MSRNKKNNAKDTKYIDQETARVFEAYVIDIIETLDQTGHGLFVIDGYRRAKKAVDASPEFKELASEGHKRATKKKLEDYGGNERCLEANLTAMRQMPQHYAFEFNKKSLVNLTMLLLVVLMHTGETTKAIRTAAELEARFPGSGMFWAIVVDSGHSLIEDLYRDGHSEGSPMAALTKAWLGDIEASGRPGRMNTSSAASGFVGKHGQELLELSGICPPPIEEQVEDELEASVARAKDILQRGLEQIEGAKDAGGKGNIVSLDAYRKEVAVNNER
jgi:hypothetical protein